MQCIHLVKANLKQWWKVLGFTKSFLECGYARNGLLYQKLLNFYKKAVMSTKEEQGTYSAIRKIPIFRITSWCEIYVERHSFLQSFGQFVRSALGLQFY